MADTGFKTTGTVVANAWSTPVTTTRINTSDNSRAEAASLTFQDAELEDFAFGIPAGATIDGIEITAEMSDGAAGETATLEISLSWNNGSNYTATKSNTQVGQSDTNKTYGGAADTWGRTWSDAEFADGTFRIKIQGKTTVGAGASCRLDYLQIKVYYTEAAGGTFVATIIVI